MKKTNKTYSIKNQIRATDCYGQYKFKFNQSLTEFPAFI